MKTFSKIFSVVQRFGFAPMLPYTTTAPIHHQLNDQSFTNVLGWKPFATFLYASQHLRSKFTHLDINERVIEIPWVFSQIDFSKPNKVLDIGWLESTVAISLATAGFKVTGVDLRKGELSHPNLTEVVGDICQTNLPSNSFDTVILLSTLEHIGLDTMYGKVEKTTSDQKAVDECFRVLKPGGRLLLTTPAAKRSYSDSFMRRYTPAQLQKMLKKWTKVTTQFYTPHNSRQVWNQALPKALPEPPAFGVALVVAYKPRRTK
jgi:SAM-dependent methyltransferase